MLVNPSSPPPFGPSVVAVTGGSGFIGSHLLDRLGQTGAHIRALTRRAMPPRDGVTWIEGDLRDHAALKNLVSGCEAVVHAAALIKARNTREFFDVNAEGTAALAHAVKQAGSPRLVMLSSLAAREPALSSYAASKQAAEAMLRDAGGGDLDWTILRAPAVYGPGDRETLKLFKTLRWGFALQTASDARIALIHVHDLCDAVMTALTQQKLSGLTLGVDDLATEGHRLDETLLLAGRLLDKLPLILPVPRPLLMTLAGANLGLAKLTGRAPMLTPGKARELAHGDWRGHRPSLADYSTWRPKITLAQGLSETLAWYRAAGWL